MGDRNPKCETGGRRALPIRLPCADFRTAAAIRIDAGQYPF